MFPLKAVVNPILSFIKRVYNDSRRQQFLDLYLEFLGIFLQISFACTPSKLDKRSRQAVVSAHKTSCKMQVTL